MSLSSCIFSEEKEVSTYVVKKSDFENIISIQGIIEPVRSTTLFCPRNIDGVITFLVEDGTHVEAGEIVAILQDESLGTDYDQQVIDLENAEAELEKIKADLQLQYALLEAQVRSNDADTEIAQLDSLQLIYSTPNQRRIKELELEKVAVEKIKYEKKLEALEIINKTDIKNTEIRIQNMVNRVNSTKERLDALILKAPQAGLAIRAHSRMIYNKQLQVGDLVWGNLPVVTIPDLSEMKVKIMAPERDYKYINIGDTVSYTFDAMPENWAGGKIISKSPVGREYTEGSKLKYFEIEASIDTMLQLPEPGLTVNCNIILKQVTDTIVIPQLAIFDEDSIKVVYVKKENKYEMRQILTGLSSQKEAIVSQGLSKEEIISLAKPPSSSIKGKKLLPDSIVGYKK